MPSGRKRSLGQSGGRCEVSGDPAFGQLLANCLAVDPEAKLPFTHGFHAYPARMHPETARRAIEAFPGGRVLDPFMGSGTTAVEAVRAGRAFVGLDISKVPLEIAWTRTRVLRPEQSRRVEQEGHRLGNRAFSEIEEGAPLPPWTRAERDWYDPHTLREIVTLKGLIDREGDEFIRRTLTCVLSSILVKLSKQISDSDVKQDAYHRPKPRGAAFRWFRDRCSELTKGLLQLGSDLHKRKVAFVEPEFKREDARTATLQPGSVDLVVTSPPYAGVYDYARHQSRRYPIFGEDPAFAEAHEMGSRRDAEKYPGDLEAAIRNALGALSKAGKILILIGDGQQVNGRSLVEKMAPALGARVTAVASQSRPNWSGGPPKREHLVLIERATSAVP
jgi:hypothetical protein